MKALADLRVYSLKHVSPEKASAQLSKFIKNAELNVSEYREQNALVLGGSPQALGRAEELLKMIDVPQMQVTLACVIVEFRKGRGFAIGVRSGAARNVGARLERLEFCRTALSWNFRRWKKTTRRRCLRGRG